jgi:membrane fusion protein, multidrug efflux system
MVPSIAILNDLSGHKVFLQKNGKITEQFVITGTRTSTEIEILQGVNIGDTIITSGLLQIKPSSLVIISELN